MINEIFPFHRSLYHLSRVFTYIYSLLIEKDISDHQNISVKLLCVYVCLSSGDLFIFFYSCCIIHTLVLSFPFDLILLQVICYHYQISREKFEPEPGLEP